MNLNDLLDTLTKAIAIDPNLDEELKEDILELVAEVNINPTHANIEVLSEVLKKLGDYSKYLGALRTMVSIETQARTIIP